MSRKVIGVPILAILSYTRSPAQRQNPVLAPYRLIATQSCCVQLARKDRTVPWGLVAEELPHPASRPPNISPATTSRTCDGVLP
jgi:hypothetical protein